jgi:pSer/pThr/pTyr-binding forkhead associated (FHA) protein
MEPCVNKGLNEPPYLLLTDPDGQAAAVDLEADNSLFAGSGSNCRILLQGDEINPIHCMFWINEERILRIQDWNTDGRTLVNGQSLTTETTLSSGDKVEIGNYLIVPVLSQADHQLVAQIPLNSTSPAESEGTGDANRNSPKTMDSGTHSDSLGQDGSAFENVSSASVLDAESPASESPNSELATAEDDHELDAGQNWEDEFSNEFGFESYNFENSQEPDTAPGFEDPRDQELELLRMEVEQLRYELAERDGQPHFESGISVDTEPGNDQQCNYVDDDQTVQLVNRLEDLLEELQSSDERIRGLEELLQFSDQAAQAEQEERTQLESWVAEIEHRVSQREAESEAEMGRVLNRLKEAQSQQRHVEAQLKQVLQSKGNNLAEASKALLQKSRDQIQDLQQQLEQVKDQNEQLRQQALCSEGEVKAHEELKQMEQKLLEAQVESSRERAEMARQRAELESLKDELAQQLNSAKDIDNADTRVRAMRQHLRDIHEEEKNALEEKRQRSLGGRISRLLNRVGR